MVDLTEEQHAAVMHARSLAFHYLSERYPDRAPALFAVACCGAVRDMLRDLNMARDVVPLINAELEPVGYAVAAIPRH